MASPHPAAGDFITAKSVTSLSSRLLALQLLVVVLVGAALYGHTLQAPWYMDDLTIILDPSAKHDLSSSLSGLFAQRGLSRLSFALNYQVGEFNPVGYHLVNIAIHLGAACLVLLLLRRVFVGQRWLPLFGALIYVAHPLQTQAVTYVVQRMASLSAFFFLLSLFLFVRGRELLASGIVWRHRRHLVFYLLSLLAGLLAILAKENAVILPLVLILFARFFPSGADRDWRSLLLYVAPFWIAPLLFSVLFFFWPLLFGTVSINHIGGLNNLVSLQGNSPLRYLFTEFQVIWIYIRLLFLPYGQALDHGYPLVQTLFNLKSLAGLCGLCALIGLAFRLRSTQPIIAAGISWFLLTLAVESSIIPIDPLFEQRLYLPLFGFVLILLALAVQIPRPVVSYSLLGGFVLIMAILTWRRNALWNDAIALYEDNLRWTPHNERVSKDLAIAYLAAKRPQEAMPLLEEVQRINPRMLTPYMRLPGIYIYLGRLDDARRILADGIRYFPQEGSLYVSMGKLLLKQGNAAAAERFLRQGIDLGSGSAEAHKLLARALNQQGRINEALQQRDMGQRLEAQERAE